MGSSSVSNTHHHPKTRRGALTGSPFLCSNRACISGSFRMTRIPRILLFSAALLSLAASTTPALVPAPQSGQSPKPALPAENNAGPSNDPFDQPRRLLQQGKYDNALAALHA